MSFKTIALTAVALATSAGISLAASHGGNPAVKARQAHMSLYGFNLGVIGAMAKGEVEYNADAAMAAAEQPGRADLDQPDELLAAGHDNGALGEETRALPAIWEAVPGRDGKGQAVNGRSGRVWQPSPVTDRKRLAPALGAVGGACNECHKTYRQSDN